jgi:hypothetical protein
VCFHQVFFSSLNLLNGPNRRVFLGGPLNRANRCLERGGICVWGYGDDDLNIIRYGFVLELRLGLYQVLYTTVLMSINQTVNPDERFDL